MTRNCFYDVNDDVKNNNGFHDHADNPDSQCLSTLQIYFVELFKSIMS